MYGADYAGVKGKDGVWNNNHPIPKFTLLHKISYKNKINPSPIMKLLYRSYFGQPIREQGKVVGTPGIIWLSKESKDGREDDF